MDSFKLNKLINKTKREAYKILYQWIKESYISFSEFIELSHYIEQKEN